MSSRAQVAILIGIVAIFATIGCSRKTGKSATISIQLGKSNQKNSALATYPSTRKACYGVSVTGPGITSVSSTCSPPLGLVGGFIAAGGAIDMTVSYGSKRRFDLYLFLQKEGENNPCPQMGVSFSKEQLAQTYLVGTADNVNIDQPSVDISITESFPGLTENLATHFALPSTCIVATTAPASPGFRHNTGSGRATGTGIQLLGHVARPNSSQDATGGGIRLRARISGGN